MNIEYKTIFSALKGFLDRKTYAAFDKALREFEGIKETSYDFNTSVLRVDYNPYVIDVYKIEQKILALKQKPLVMGGVTDAAAYAVTNINSCFKKSVMHLIAVLLLGFLIAAANNMGLSGYTVLAASFILVYVLMYGAHKKAISDFKIDFNLLFSIAVTAGFGYSALMLVLTEFTKVSNVYFLWKPTVFVVLIYCFGVFMLHIERANRKTKIMNLLKLKPRFALLLEEGGGEKEISVLDIKAGDLIVVRQGMIVPCDAIVDDGAAKTDPGALNCAQARTVAKGDKVRSGYKILEGRIIVKSASCGENTTLTNYIEKSLEITLGLRNHAFYGDKPVFVFACLLAAVIIGALFLVIRIKGAGEYSLLSFLAACGLMFLPVPAVLFIKNFTQSAANTFLKKYVRINLYTCKNIKKVTLFVITDMFASAYKKEDLKTLVEKLIKRGIKTVYVSFKPQQEAEPLVNDCGIERAYYGFDYRRLVDLVAALKAEGNSIATVCFDYKETKCLKNSDFMFAAESSSGIIKNSADSVMAGPESFMPAFLNTRKACRIAKQNVWLCYIAALVTCCISFAFFIADQNAAYLLNGVYLSFSAGAVLVFLNTLRLKRVLK